MIDGAECDEGEGRGKDHRLRVGTLGGVGRNHKRPAQDDLERKACAGERTEGRVACECRENGEKRVGEIGGGTQTRTEETGSPTVVTQIGILAC